LITLKTAERDNASRPTPQNFGLCGSRDQDRGLEDYNTGYWLQILTGSVTWVGYMYGIPRIKYAEF